MTKRPSHRETAKLTPGTLTEPEVSRILALAAQMQANSDEEQPTLSLADIERIATEAGIDRKYVHDAVLAASLEQEETEFISSLLGGAAGVHVVRRMPKVEMPTAQNHLEEVLRSFIPKLRRVDLVGSALAWDGATPTSTLEVTVVPGSDGVRLTISEDLSNRSRRIFLAIVSWIGVGGAVCSRLSWVLLPPLFRRYSWQSAARY